MVKRLCFGSSGFGLALFSSLGGGPFTFYLDALSAARSAATTSAALRFVSAAAASAALPLFLEASAASLRFVSGAALPLVVAPAGLAGDSCVAPVGGVNRGTGGTGGVKPQYRFLFLCLQ